MKSVVVVIICSGLCVCWAALTLSGGSLLVDGPSSQCHPQRRGNTWSGRWEHLQSYPAVEIPASMPVSGVYILQRDSFRGSEIIWLP